MSKRRLQTRERVLDAATDVFAEGGLGWTTVEQVCERAGFTRGAFYSNFSSLEELFLAIWSQRRDTIPARFRDTSARVAGGGALTVREFGEHLDTALPLDDTWYPLSLDFTAYALRNPAARKAWAAQVDATVRALTPLFKNFAERAGRVVTDPTGLAYAVIAVHDGTSAQCLTAPDNRRAHERRIDVFTRIVLAYTSPASARPE